VTSVFFATPNGVAMEQAPALLDAGVRVIDLAADFRIKDVAEWEPLVRDAACQPGVGREGGLWTARMQSRG
jgi:N-acetyl-gamma-glutamylphosphate reductase